MCVSRMFMCVLECVYMYESLASACFVQPMEKGAKLRRPHHIANITSALNYLEQKNVCIMISVNYLAHCLCFECWQFYLPGWFSETLCGFKVMPTQAAHWKSWVYIMVNLGGVVVRCPPQEWATWAQTLLSSCGFCQVVSYQWLKNW